MDISNGAVQGDDSSTVRSNGSVQGDDSSTVSSNGSVQGDMWDDMWKRWKRYFKECLPFDSEEIKGWWSEVQECSSLIINTVHTPAEWQYLMELLGHADVSGIECLKFCYSGPNEEWHWRHWYDWMKHDELPHRSVQVGEVSGEEMIGLGIVLGSGRFLALKKLEITGSFRVLSFVGLDSASVAAAFRTGYFANLLQLTLDIDDHNLTGYDINDIYAAMIEGGISHLTALAVKSTINVAHGLHALLSSGCLKNLQQLAFEKNGLFDAWRILMHAIKSRLLPNIVRLSLWRCGLRNDDLADLVDGTGNWFNALEDLSLSYCEITSEGLCAMVDAIMKVPKRGLAMKNLNLSGNQMDDRAVDALVSLITSDRLRLLEKLNLIDNQLTAGALARLMGTIQEGHLPSLKELDWRLNRAVNDKVAESIAKAYLENGALTTEILIDWGLVTDRSLEAQVQVYKERNERLLPLRKKLEEEFKVTVPLSSAKVFLCGYPEVGKTTLRRSLERPLGLSTRLMWETRPKLLKEPRTKGIELSRIQDDKTTLIFWDLAGQEEFHVLHGTFFADLGLESGKATTFVLVLKPAFVKSMDDDLKYWLKFIASGSSKHLKRHVIIVLNCFGGTHGFNCCGGNECTEEEKDVLTNSIKDFASRTHLSGLDIHLEPFINDVRVAEVVQRLKHHLSKQAQTLLQDVQVPKACYDLLEDLKRWSNDEKRKQRPIFSWQAFEEGWKKKRAVEEDFPTENLKTYATYLHEIGEIIYFHRKESTDPGSGIRSIVVPDPQWFCREVVGQLLLPKHMVKGGKSIKVGNDGSISMPQFQAYFKHLLPHDSQIDDVISMLEQMGLCYRGRDEKEGRDKIIVPALITGDNISTLTEWEGKGSHGVMGRSLATDDKDWSAIPGMLFRRLQVQLAQHKDISQADSDYRAGKSSSTFKVGAHLVLIQFDEDHSDPNDDRIDILVKSRLDGNSTDVSFKQVDCICEIMQIVEKLCARWCPGLKYNVKAIRPWDAAQGTPKMTERQLISLTEIKARLIKGEEHSSWELSGSCVKLQTFLSKNELQEVFGRSELVYGDCKRDAVILGLLTEGAVKQIEACEEERRAHKVRSANMQSMYITSESNDNGVLTTTAFEQRMQAFFQQLEKVIREESSLTREHIDQKFIELLREIQHKHGVLVRHIQELQTFSIEEKERSVPRYIYLILTGQDKENVLKKLKSVIEYSFELHLLCEAHYKTGLLHEVDGQVGISLTRQKEWVEKISPWVRRSLQVAVMVGKAVGNFYLPGIFSLISSLIPDLDFGEWVPTIVDKAATILLDEDKGEGPAQPDYGTAEAVDVKARTIAEDVVKELRDELCPIEFTKKIGLKKMWLEETPQLYRESSAQAQPSVKWVCQLCYEEYVKNPKNKAIG